MGGGDGGDGGGRTFPILYITTPDRPPPGNNSIFRHIMMLEYYIFCNGIILEILIKLCDAK